MIELKQPPIFHTLHFDLETTIRRFFFPPPLASCFFSRGDVGAAADDETLWQRCDESGSGSHRRLVAWKGHMNSAMTQAMVWGGLPIESWGYIQIIQSVMVSLCFTWMISRNGLVKLHMELWRFIGSPSRDPFCLDGPSCGFIPYETMVYEGLRD